MRLPLVIWCTIFATGFAQAQRDTVKLKEFSVVDSTVISLSGGYLFKIDSIKKISAVPMTDLAAMLSRFAGLPFKNYGPGLIATPTFRGGDANHTQVVWNGMVLNSPMLGTTDFSVLPTHQFDQLSIHSGAGSSLYASGGIGSVVALEQRLDYEKQAAMSAVSAGSFGFTQALAHVNIPLNFKKASALSFHVDRLSQQNDFPYRDIASKPFQDKALRDSGFQRTNLSLSYGSYLGKSTVLEVTYWLNSAERSLPVPINLDQPSAHQEDEAHRALIAFRSSHKSWRFQSRLLLESNRNDFDDERIAVLNSNRFRAIQQHAEASNRHSENFETFARIGFQTILASSENYGQRHQSSQLSGLLVEKFQFKKGVFKGDLGVRYEQWDKYIAALPMASVLISPFASRKGYVKGAVSQTARFPTLNERYWTPGGNPDIKPEEGWTAELGAGFQHKVLSFEATYYQSKVQNRIRWLPNGSFFSPVNIDLSEIRGIDASASWSKHFSRIHFSYNGVYHLTDAKGANNQASLLPLTYIPKHVTSQNASVGLNKVSWYLNYQWMGERSLVPDGSVFMPSYQLVSSGVSYVSGISVHSEMHISVWIDNLLDVNYQNMPWRPMPGRSFQFKLEFRWLK